jgi:hypothetical protein
MQFQNAFYVIDPQEDAKSKTKNGKPDPPLRLFAFPIFWWFLCVVLEPQPPIYTPYFNKNISVTTTDL